MVDVKGKRIMMLKDPITVLTENLTGKIGAPQDIMEAAAN